ncbi:hypothetical protein QW180_06980 [Vibrio sinaloensis]|nr:hypothetical protein [Vibrio sinaloensis]
MDYSQVSDVDYFTDVDSSIGNREDGQLVQEGKSTIPFNELGCHLTNT